MKPGTPSFSACVTFSVVFGLEKPPNNIVPASVSQLVWETLSSTKVLLVTHSPEEKVMQVVVMLVIPGPPVEFDPPQMVRFSIVCPLLSSGIAGSEQLSPVMGFNTSTLVKNPLAKPPQPPDMMIPGIEIIITSLT